MEGERVVGAAEHLRACPRCQSLVADLHAIQSAGMKLGAEEFAPPARIWFNILRQIEAEGSAKRPSWLERIAGVKFEFPRPALAGAYLSLLLVGGTLLGYQNNVQGNREQWLAGMQTSSDSLANQLRTVEEGSNSGVYNETTDPVVAASLHQNLAIVDNLIAVCEKSVREDPQDELARDYLYGAYQQKAQLLETFNERGVNVQ